MATWMLKFTQTGDTFGGWLDQDLEEFIQNVECQMIVSSITTATEKAHYLMLCLEVKSPVDKWFQGLDPVVKMDWAQLEAEFMQKWTVCQAPLRLDMEKMEDLLNHRLKPEEVSEQAPPSTHTSYGPKKQWCWHKPWG
jgi:hypothetical protein